MAKRHPVQPGDCLSSIGVAYGFFPGTLWEHPENAGLKRLRQDPNILLAGEDEVFVPDKQPKEVACATGKRHSFRRRGVPERLRLRLLWPDNSPRQDLAYRLSIEGAVVNGRTDQDGQIELWIPPGAASAELVLDPGGSAEKHTLALGQLPPSSQPKGVRVRLDNLGYKTGGAIEGPVFSNALSAFQKDEGLPVTGEVDEATRAALVARHRS